MGNTGITKEVIRIKKEFKAGDLAYIDAIDELIALGYDPLVAEEMVSDWDEEGMSSPSPHDHDF